MNSENNMRQDPDPEPEVFEDDMDVGNDDEDIGQEYADVNQSLDQIACYLDRIEERNDSIYARLQDLLESNRQTRQEMEAERLSKEVKNPSQDRKPGDVKVSPREQTNDSTSQQAGDK